MSDEGLFDRDVSRREAMKTAIERGGVRRPGGIRDCDPRWGRGSVADAK
ncbi:MAG: hypothetical protein M3Y58_22115 [Chloroflexota bacterium]|nr:hypothetical protein [Chloroflexota bacterium]